MIRLLRNLVSDIPRGWSLLWLSLLCAVLASAASVALMGASGWLLSRAAEHPPVLYLMVAVTSVRFFGVSRGVFRYAERLVSHSLALRMQSALRMDVYSRLARTTWLGGRRGDLLVRVVTDVEAVMDLVVRVALPFCSAGIVVVAASAVISTLSWPAGLALFGSAVLAGVILPWLARLASARADRSIAPQRGQLGHRTHELARTAEDLVAYGVDGEYVQRAMQVDEELRRAELKTVDVRALAAAGQVFAGALAFLVALWVGGQQVAAGELWRVHLAVLVLTPLALHEVLSTLTEAAQVGTRAGAALGRVREVMDREPVGAGDRVPGPVEPDPCLVVDEVTLAWPGADPVLSGLSLSVSAGERVAVVGRSGVGKTTLAATLLGLIPAGAGEVTVRGRVGYLSQSAHVFDTTVAENVRIGNKDASDDDIRTALARAGLDLPLDRMVGEHGGQLSGGEVQRLALARLLVGEHQVFILDEPTEHLDAETATRLRADLWAATEQAPVLVITHDPEVIADCTRVVDLAAHQPVG